MKKQESPQNIKSFKHVEFSNRYLTIFALVFGVIGAFFLIKTLAAPSLVLSVEAENMTRTTGARVVSDSTASLGQAVLLSGNTSLNSTFALAASSTQLNVRVKANYCSKNWPKIRVSVDGAIVSRTSIVNSKDWKTLQSDVNLNKGSHRLKIDGINLGSERGCLRTLSVDGAAFYGENAVPPPPPLPAVSISANPSTVNSGTASTLTWTTTNATSCAASGSWSGTQPTEGTASTGALNKNSTYTLSCTGSGGSINASTTVIVLPVVTPPTPPPPTPTPTPNPTPTPPPSSGTNSCLVSNRTSWALAGTNCKAGTTITRTNQAWSCTQPASSYGALPIRVVLNWTTAVSTGGAGMVDFNNGCSGDGNNDTVDFIIQMNNLNGNAGGVGGTADSAKTRPSSGGPSNLQVTGNFDCGPPASGAHPDTWQFQHSGDRNITIVNGTSGNPVTGMSTCQGAGGIIYTSGSGIHFIGGNYTLCNHAMNGTQAGPNKNNTVVGGTYRGGRNDGSDPNCVGYSGTGGCTGSANFTAFESVTCQNWSSSSKTWVTDPNP